MSADPAHDYVSRGGLKLEHALDTFGIDPSGLVCADFGCNVGGFTDCLLRRGAAHVYAVDTGYGELAWKLRNDDRVTVMERTNALHVEPPTENKPSLVVIDLGWTPQRQCLPVATAWMDDPSSGRIVTLIKPHYEASHFGIQHRGILPDDLAEDVMRRVIKEIGELGYRVLGESCSPLRGGKGKGKAGNIEFLAHIAPGI
ncbi:MAG: SAM-dependent methyltransferase [Phycisphaerales bacterium]